DVVGGLSTIPLGLAELTFTQVELLGRFLAGLLVSKAPLLVGLPVHLVLTIEDLVLSPLRSWLGARLFVSVGVRLVRHGLAFPGLAFLAALLVDRPGCPLLGFVLRDAPLAVGLLDVLVLTVALATFLHPSWHLLHLQWAHG